MSASEEPLSSCPQNVRTGQPPPPDCGRFYGRPLSVLIFVHVFITTY